MYEGLIFSAMRYKSVLERAGQRLSARQSQIDYY